MTVSSASTFAEVQAEVEDTLDYAIDQSVAKCERFIRAAGIYLVRHSEEIRKDSHSVRDDYRRIEKLLDEAQDWYAANGGNASVAGDPEVIHGSLRGYRGVE